MQSFDHVVLQDHATNINHYIFNIRVPMATKLDRMMTYFDLLLPKKPHDPLITWPCEIEGSITREGWATKRFKLSRTFFFFFFLLVQASGHFWVICVSWSCKHGWPKLESFIGHFNYCVCVLQFRVWEHDMPCALEMNSNGGLRRGHVESWPSTTKNIVSPLPQCLWPPNLAGWWLTMRGSHP